MAALSTFSVDKPARCCFTLIGMASNHKTSPFVDPTNRVGTTTRVSPSQLNTYHRNPRRGDVTAVAGSLRANGQYKPICVNVGTFTGRRNEVLAGNHTLMAFRNLAEAYPTDPQWAEIAVHWVDVDDDRAARIVAADNRTSELGTNDVAELAALLQTIPDLEGTGYDSGDLAALLDGIGAATDDLPGTGGEPVDKPEPLPRYDGDQFTLHHGDSAEVIATLPDNSVDAIVTDPPYGLDFMGKHWDTGAVAFDVEFWRQCLRVLRPGGHVAAFGGTRTWHRLAVAIEDAGFEVRDNMAWLYGSGFPKSLDVSKAIDKTAGAERETIRTPMGPSGNKYAKGLGDDRPWMRNAAERGFHEAPGPCAVTDAARQWQGWGTALKPAFEPIVLARKPFDTTVAANVQEHGTGALNIDGCRVATTDTWEATGVRSSSSSVLAGGQDGSLNVSVSSAHDLGRWPANVLLDPFTAGLVDEQSGVSTSPLVGNVAHTRGSNTIGAFAHEGHPPSLNGHGDTSGASRFFPIFKYTAKAATSERPKDDDGTAHPTVKPLDLMRWLVRLITPPKGVVLEPFCGSGTTLEACLNEGMACVAIEREADYIPLIVQRIERAGAEVTTA